MKTRFSLLLLAVFVAGFTHAIDTIRVSDPQTWTTQELQPYVGKTVVFSVPMVVCSNYNGYTVSTRRLFMPTNQVLPKTKDKDSYNAIVSLNSGGELDITNIVGYHRCGEKIHNLKAKVNSAQEIQFIDGQWHGNTRADMEKANIHQMVGVDDNECPECLVVCAYNIENYDGSSINKRTKIGLALKIINADIYGFVEMKTEKGRSAIIQDLNDLCPSRNYTICKEKVGQGDGQTVAFVYDSRKIKHLGDIQYNNTRTQNRKKMACFEQLSNGERFIFSVNHFKAKLSGGTGGNADMGDGQSYWNADRVEEAQSVLEKYRRWSAEINEKDVLIMGDLNANGKEDPITTLTGSGMIDLHRAFHADSSYSYSFSDKLYNYQQLAGYLDHALCNTTLRPQITGMTAFHINSDEKSNNDQTMFRGSDHDPVVVGLKLNGSLEYNDEPKLNTEDIISGNARQLIIRDAVKDGQRSFYAIYNIEGHLIDRQEITHESQNADLPSAPGIYIVYVYYNGNVYPYKMIVR
ncbi:MAG: T9SS type A sorting domain-containing protein [Paludibacteraceae bacterium]|nr:T9SS type A sorting domain-containing protein [Paludibacteraceae bacterium]